MPIYFLVSIGVFLSVEFCFALKIYLKGAPFYNASVPLRTLGTPSHACGRRRFASAPRLRRLGRLAEAIVPHPCSANQIGVVSQRSKRQFCFLRRNETTSAANHFPNAIEKERRALHDAATQHNSVGRKKIDQIGDSQA